MAGERLSSILKHLTPGSSALSSMYLFPAFSKLFNHKLIATPQHLKERRRCSDYLCHPNAVDEGN